MHWPTSFEFATHENIYLNQYCEIYTNITLYIWLYLEFDVFVVYFVLCKFSEPLIVIDVCQCRCSDNATVAIEKQPQLLNAPRLTVAAHAKSWADHNVEHIHLNLLLIN